MIKPLKALKSLKSLKPPARHREPLRRGGLVQIVEAVQIVIPNSKSAIRNPLLAFLAYEL